MVGLTAMLETENTMGWPFVSWIRANFLCVALAEGPALPKTSSCLTTVVSSEQTSTSTVSVGWGSKVAAPPASAELGLLTRVGKGTVVFLIIGGVSLWWGLLFAMMEFY